MPTPCRPRCTPPTRCSTPSAGSTSTCRCCHWRSRRAPCRGGGAGAAPCWPPLLPLLPRSPHLPSPMLPRSTSPLRSLPRPRPPQDYLAAPMPYLVGIQADCLPLLRAMALEEVVLMDLDCLGSCTPPLGGPADDYHALPFARELEDVFEARRGGAGGRPLRGARCGESLWRAAPGGGRGGRGAACGAQRRRVRSLPSHPHRSRPPAPSPPRPGGARAHPEPHRV